MCKGVRERLCFVIAQAGEAEKQSECECESAERVSLSIGVKGFRASG